MPVTPTYPGVYLQEISSGVRTITGVSTSKPFWGQLNADQLIKQLEFLASLIMIANLADWMLTQR